MKTSTLSEMLSQLEELQYPEPKESMWLKTYSNDELEELIEAMDAHFLFNYNFSAIFSKSQAVEIELFLRLREDVLKYLME